MQFHRRSFEYSAGRERSLSFAQTLVPPVRSLFDALTDQVHPSRRRGPVPHRPGETPDPARDARALVDVATVIAAFAAAKLGAWHGRRRMKRRAEAMDRHETVRVACVLLRQAYGERWRRGHLVIDPTGTTWAGRTKFGAVLSLPPDLRRLRQRKATMREALFHFNRLCRVIECTSGEGGIQFAVMPRDLDLAVAALARTTK